MIKKYNIKGVNLKSELIICFSIIPFIIILGAISIAFYHQLNGTEYRNIPFYIFLCSLLLGASAGLLFAKFLGGRLRASWNIELTDDHLIIHFKSEKWNFG